MNSRRILKAQTNGAILVYEKNPPEVCIAGVAWIKLILMFLTIAK